MTNYLLWNADTIEDLDYSFVGHIRYQTLTVIEQLEKPVRPTEVFARVNAELIRVTLSKRDQSNNCLTSHSGAQIEQLRAQWAVNQLEEVREEGIVLYIRELGVLGRPIDQWLDLLNRLCSDLPVNACHSEEKR